MLHHLKSILRHDTRFFAVPLMVGALIVAGGSALAWGVAERLLYNYADKTARAWAEYVIDEFVDLDAIFVTGVPNVIDLATLRAVRSIGNVFMFHFVDAEGRIVLSSDQFKVGDKLDALDEANFVQDLRRSEVMSYVKTGNLQDMPDRYGEVYYSVIDDGALRGIIGIYIDITADNAAYQSTVSKAVVGFALLIALAAFAPSLIVYRNVRALRAAQGQIQALAYNDPLTGLPNRRNFQEALETALDGEAAKGALVLLDLDGFKAVNDSLGHPQGDALLRQVAERLTTCLREGDTIARLGGDEFAILLPGCKHRELVEVQERVLARVARPFDLAGGVARIGVSIGAVLYPEHARAVEALLANADIALYEAKNQGRNRAVTFRAAYGHAVRATQVVEAELHEALAAGALCLHYQPIVDLASERVHGVEALLRWRHPERGLLSPAAFLPVAEAKGLMSTIGARALDMALAQMRAWRDEGLDLGYVAVNLAAQQLARPDLVAAVEANLARHGVAPERLVLELTERCVMDRGGEQVSEHLAGLRRLGVRLALDDFGTGHASLTHAKSLPIGTIKIDRGFTADLETDATDAAVVGAILSLAKGLGVDVVAEGIEQRAQADLLRRAGCAFGQGYLYGKPVPAAEIRDLVRDRHPLTA